MVPVCGGSGLGTLSVCVCHLWVGEKPSMGLAEGDQEGSAPLISISQWEHWVTGAGGATYLRDEARQL